VVKHCKYCANLVHRHGVMFVILVDLHAAQDRVTEDGVGGHFFGQSNGDGSWAFVDLVGG
jgi:hypothetical protein